MTVQVSWHALGDWHNEPDTFSSNRTLTTLTRTHARLRRYKTPMRPHMRILLHKLPEDRKVSVPTHIHRWHLSPLQDLHQTITHSFWKVRASAVHSLSVFVMCSFIIDGDLFMCVCACVCEWVSVYVSAWYHYNSLSCRHWLGRPHCWMSSVHVILVITIIHKRDTQHHVTDHAHLHFYVTHLSATTMLDTRIALSNNNRTHTHCRQPNVDPMEDGIFRFAYAKLNELDKVMQWSGWLCCQVFLHVSNSHDKSSIVTMHKKLLLLLLVRIRK